jgi:hypothetical protein
MFCNMCVCFCNTYIYCVLFVYLSLLFCSYFVLRFLCFVVMCIFIFVCTSVGLLPPGESPIAVSKQAVMNAAKNRFPVFLALFLDMWTRDLSAIKPQPMRVNENAKQEDIRPSCKPLLGFEHKVCCSGGKKKVRKSGDAAVVTGCLELL